MTHQGDSAAPTAGNGMAVPKEAMRRAVTCFTPGTSITTLKGKVAVETLRPGDLVLTRDRGFQPLVWRGSYHVDFTGPEAPLEMRPILIRANALGNGQPERDMVVSPNHRLLSTDDALHAHPDEAEVLIEAVDLVGQPGISRLAPASVTYTHLLFERHEVILSENTWTESLLLSRDAAARLLGAGPDNTVEFTQHLRRVARGRSRTPARVLA